MIDQISKKSFKAVINILFDMDTKSMCPLLDILLMDKIENAQK